MSPESGTCSDPAVSNASAFRVTERATSPGGRGAGWPASGKASGLGRRGCRRTDVRSLREMAALRGFSGGHHHADAEHHGGDRQADDVLDAEAMRDRSRQDRRELPPIADSLSEGWIASRNRQSDTPSSRRSRFFEKIAASETRSSMPGRRTIGTTGRSRAARPGAVPSGSRRTVGRFHQRVDGQANRLISASQRRE